jgi:hypothetical protein
MSVLAVPSIKTPVSNASSPQILLVAWGSLQNPVNATVGDYNVPLYVVVSGVVTKAILYPTSATPFGTTSPIYGVIVSSTQTQTVVEFVVSLNSYGTFYVPMYVEYYAGNNQTKSETLTLPLYVSPPAYPILQAVYFNGNQFAVSGSGVTQLSLTIYNPSGSVMRNVIIKLNLPNGVYSLTGQPYVSVLIPQVPPYSYAQGSTQVNVTAHVAPGTYYEPYQVQYTDPLGGTHVNFYTNATIFVVPSQPLKFQLKPVSTSSGNVASLLINVVGQGTIQNLQLVTQLPIVYSNFTPFMNVNGRAVLEFRLLASPNLPPGLYPIEMVVTYSSYGNAFQTTYYSFVNVTVPRVTPFVTSLEWVTTPLPKGVAQAKVAVVNPYNFPINDVMLNFTGNASTISVAPIAVIPPEGFSTTTVTLKLSNLTGQITLPYTITFRVNGQEYSVKSAIKVGVYSYPQLEIRLIPGSVYPGEWVDLELNVSNPTEVEMSQVSIRLQSPLVQILNQPTTIGHLKPNSWSVVAVSMFVPPNAPSGVSFLKADVTFVYNGQTYAQSYQVPLHVVHGYSPIQVSVKPPILYYQLQNNVTLTLTNVAPWNLTNVTVQLLYPPGIVQISPQTFYVGNLESKRTIDLKFSAYSSNAATAVVPVGVVVSYLANGAPGSVTHNVTLTFTGLVRLVLLSPNFTYQNGTVAFNAILLNTGNAQANNVIIYYPGGNQYIGQVPINSPLVFQIPATFDGRTASVNFTISYETPLYQIVNESYHYSKEITIPPPHTSTSTTSVTVSLDIMFLVMFVVAIIVLTIYFRRRRK